MTTPPPHPQAPGTGNEFSAVPPYVGGPQQQAGNGMAVAALVLGIISVPLLFLNWVDSIIAVLAIVFAVLGIRRAARGAGRRGMSVAGLVLGIVGLVASVIVLVVVVLFAKDVTQRCQDQVGHKPNATELQQCIQNGI